MLEQRLLPSQALRLAIALLPPLNILTFIDKINNAGILHPGAVESNLTTWNKTVKTYSQQDIALLETKLRSSQSTGLRRLGFGLLIELSNQHGWTKERCEHLDEYCADIELWISEAAGLIEPPQSLDVPKRAWES